MLFAGAIPVVVGEPWDINRSFSYLANDPNANLPWVLASTWPAAAATVRSLFAGWRARAGGEPDKVAALARRTRAWWLAVSCRLEQEVKRAVDAQVLDAAGPVSVAPRGSTSGAMRGWTCPIVAHRTRTSASSDADGSRPTDFLRTPV